MIKKLRSQPFTTELWIDGGHNEAAGRAIAAFLNDSFDGTSHLIFGMINSKDIKTFLSEMAPMLDSIACVTIPEQVASLTGAIVCKEAEHIHKKPFVANNVAEAINKIILNNKNNGNLRILICGSLYLCGHILIDHT